MTNPHKQILNVRLADGDTDTIGSLAVRIQASDFSIALFHAGYGDFGSAEGHGCPLSLELYQGRLRLIVFPDISKEEPLIIDLEGARETNRRLATASS